MIAGAAGTYYVAVAGPPGSAGGSSPYTISATTWSGAHENDVANFTPIAADGLVSGVFASNGEQWFSVALQAGQTISVDTGRYVFYNEFGERVVSHSSYGADNIAFSYFTAPTAGAYFFQVAGSAVT